MCNENGKYKRTGALYGPRQRRELERQLWKEWTSLLFRIQVLQTVKVRTNSIRNLANSMIEEDGYWDIGAQMDTDFHHCLFCVCNCPILIVTLWLG